ncbi:MAG: hypothetical protein BalsKO_07160 [Balneolaceae bacterium]
MYRSYSNDKFLYYFTSAEIVTKKIFPDKKLRFSSYIKTNDPYETKNWSLTIKDWVQYFESLPTEKQSSFLQLVNSFNEERLDHIKKFKSQIKVLCFSQDDPNFDFDQYLDYSGYKRGWGFPRMWNQYGDKHKGVCLMFEKDSLEGNLQKLFKDDFSIYARKVSYSDELIDKEVNKIDPRKVMKYGIENSLLTSLQENISSFSLKRHSIGKVKESIDIY